MTKLMREPLAHFLLLGAMIFVAYSLLSKPSGEPGKIVITQGQLASMAETFSLTRQRPPTREEWEGLIRERVRTAFTVAHSLTLAAATLGFVHVPGPPVEAGIALSIVFVAAEIVHGRQGRSGVTERFPWIVAFTFGLLHGFGFASALSEVGLPQSAIPVALLFFNVGVEIGQLFFIASIFAVMALGRQVTQRIGVSQPAWAWRVPAYAIGSVSAFWIIQRISLF